MDVSSISLLSHTQPLLESSLNINVSRADNFFLEKIMSIDEAVKTSEAAAVKYLRGEDIPVHQVIISMGKAQSELQLAVEIRNKIIAAYESIVSMQV